MLPDEILILDEITLLNSNELDAALAGKDVLETIDERITEEGDVLLPPPPLLPPQDINITQPTIKVIIFTQVFMTNTSALNTDLLCKFIMCRLNRYNHQPVTYIQQQKRQQVAGVVQRFVYFFANVIVRAAGFFQQQKTPSFVEAVSPGYSSPLRYYSILQRQTH